MRGRERDRQEKAPPGEDQEMLREDPGRTGLEQARDQDQLEQAIERANAMALEAEVANIELNQIINTSPDGMILIYDDRSIRRINTTLLDFLGLKEKEVLSRRCHQILSGHWCGTDQCPLEKIRQGQDRIELDVKRKGKDGRLVPFIFSATPFRGLDGELLGMVARFKDITDRKYAEEMLKEANRRLERLATVDGLTQVANRRYFEQALEKEWYRLNRTEDPLSLILCDLDYFKSYNDTYGHLQGDDCLRTMATILSGQVKRAGDCVARYGGEEFAAILPSTSESGAAYVAEQLRLAVEESALEHKESPLSKVTISVGVATVVPAVNRKPEYLVRCADKALYRAKAMGRNRVVIWEKREEPIDDA